MPARYRDVCAPRAIRAMPLPTSCAPTVIGLRHCVPSQMPSGGLARAGSRPRRSRQASPWAAHGYCQAREGRCKHSHAIRLLARAWLRILWRTWQDGVPYDPEKHLAARAFLAKAQRGRWLLRRAGESPSQPPRLSFGHRSASRNQSFPRGAQSTPKFCTWTTDPDKVISAVNEGSKR